MGQCTALCQKYKVYFTSHFRANFNWIHKWAPRFSYQRCIKMVSRISGQKFCYFSWSWKTPFGHFWWKSQYLCRETIWETESQIFNKCCCGQSCWQYCHFELWWKNSFWCMRLVHWKYSFGFCQRIRFAFNQRWKNRNWWKIKSADCWW